MKPGSKAWKKFMAKLYGIGAAVVIIGAMFKIQHWPFASLLLVVGLSTEAVIFFFSAFEPLHEEPDWSLVYPELALPDEDKKSLKVQNKGSRSSLGGGGGSGISGQLDNMLAEAKIEPELIASLGDGMRSFSSQAKQLSDISESATASSEYSSSLRGAAQKVSVLADSYATASESLTGLNEAAKQGSSIGQNMSKMSGNLESLNNMYELQLQELDKTRAMYSDMSALMTHLKDSVADTKAYKDNIAELSSNLKSLNNVYSNMLNAMGAARQ